jgi:hypothetical protein
MAELLRRNLPRVLVEGGLFYAMARQSLRIRDEMRTARSAGARLPAVAVAASTHEPPKNRRTRRPPRDERHMHPPCRDAPSSRPLPAGSTAVVLKMDLAGRETRSC